MVQFGKNYFFLEIPINLKFPKKISFLSQRFAGAFFFLSAIPNIENKKVKIKTFLIWL